MSEQTLPYVLATGRIGSLLTKISEAQAPSRFTQDFLETKLGMKGGSATALIPLLKRIGFLSNDGTPTDLYRKVRNPDTAGAALAESLRRGYSELFARNEYAQDLTREKLTNLIVEITGKSKDDRVVNAVVGTFWTLKEKAKFDEALPEGEPEKAQEEATENVNWLPTSFRQQHQHQRLGLNLSYTINLNLPETDDVNVFNAIFKSLKENLLKE